MGERKERGAPTTRWLNKEYEVGWRYCQAWICTKMTEKMNEMPGSQLAESRFTIGAFKCWNLIMQWWGRWQKGEFSEPGSYKWRKWWGRWDIFKMGLENNFTINEGSDLWQLNRGLPNLRQTRVTNKSSWRLIDISEKPKIFCKSYIFQKLRIPLERVLGSNTGVRDLEQV